jgi:hypothetical protein
MNFRRFWRDVSFRKKSSPNGKGNSVVCELSKIARETVGLLVKVAHCVEPLDHVKGRIRMGVSLFKLPKLLALVGDINLDEDARLLPGLKGYEINAWSLSATILYDPKALPFELWDDFCSIGKNPDAESSFRRRVLSLFEKNTDLTDDPESK